MVKCGSRCPAHMDIDCSFNPDAMERCELPYRRETTVSTRTAGMWEEPSV